MAYIPLRAASGRSLLRGALRLVDYVRAGEKAGMPALGLSDWASFYGAPFFYKLCEARGIKPVLGADFPIGEVTLSFFIKNEDGYLDLLQISYLHKTGKLSLEKAKKLSSGLAVVLSSSDERVRRYFEEEDTTVFSRWLADLSEGFSDFRIGIDASGESEAYLDRLRKFAASRGYRTIAFPHIEYLKKEDAIALHMLRAIAEDAKLEKKELSGPNYFISVEEADHFYTKEELAATFALVDEVDFKLFKKRGGQIPYPVAEGKTNADLLEELAGEGLKAKGLVGDDYRKRLVYELGVIVSMGYADYFLIVRDYVLFAKENGIPVGPGRGSAAGSLVAYALGIVDVDPLKHGLLFERFLNIGRRSLPDIDLDVGDERRSEVIAYLKRRWSKDRVANIATLQTIMAKQSLRDVGRIYGYPTRDIDMLSRLIVDPKLSLRENYKTNRRFRDLVDSDAYYLKIVSLAAKIEGLPRQSGMHAAGIVLNAAPIRDVLPVDVDAEGNLIEEYEMDYLEEQGFLKMDILGLRNLTIIEECLALIYKDRGIRLAPGEIPYDDEEAIALIASGRTAGLFQLESAGMRQAIRTLRPSVFEDVVALLALYRPGPMGNIAHYAKRKDGSERFSYLSPVLEDILKPTYGIIVYQEQIIRIAHLMAGLTLGEADLFRRAISKKDSARLAALKRRFVEGALNKGYGAREAEDVFALILRFADYGFNRSHSVSYAMISTRMAYLKDRYPAEFYAAVLNVGGSDATLSMALSELRRSGIRTLRPDVNASSALYNVKDGALVFPLTLIKGLPQALILAVVKEREASGAYKDFFDFVLRTFRRKMGGESLLKLVDAGAFDSLEPSRASLRASISRALIYSEMMSSEDGTLVLDPGMFEKPRYERRKDDPKENLAREHQVLGTVLSGAPFSPRNDIKVVKAIDAPGTPGSFTISVMISALRVIRTKKGRDMAFLSCFDDSGEIELTVFADAFEAARDIIRKDALILAEGRYDRRRGEFTAERISSEEA